ncbi:translocating chain-associated membrane protein 2 isoform X3 [Tursiops truncatus]|uniref:translocating chain-associated membrane protein 2 isoform X3 n=1 Tax=Tursiops truncatus TaxID=9739 RepID=UPI003CCF821C
MICWTFGAPTLHFVKLELHQRDTSTVTGRCGQRGCRPAPNLSGSQPLKATARTSGSTELSCPPRGQPAASAALPFPRRKERPPRSGKPGPTSCPGRALRPCAPLPAPGRENAAGRERRARGTQPGAPPSGPAPAPPPRVPGGERVNRAGGGARASQAHRVRAAGGEGAAPGAVPDGGGGGGRRKGAGPRSCWALGRRREGERAAGRRAEWAWAREVCAAAGERRVRAPPAVRARCHGFPPEDEKLPALQPGVRHPQPCGHRLLPGALRPHRAYVRDGETVHYHYGPKDLVTVLFYIFITIILHAVVQEYILDKISKRLHLSKVKHSKFNESGQLVVFHLSSVIWCFYVVVTEGYLTNPRSLWEDYPHVYLPFQVKFFYLCQLAYWLHALPELYFQKEEIPRQLQYICLYLVHIAGAYLFNLSRLGLVLLLLQYSTEFLFHTARLCYFADENNEKLFNAWAAAFAVTRLFILTLAVLAIGFGLARVENQAFDPEKGNFNTLLCRLCMLLLLCAAQAWLMWRFIHSQLRHWREHWSEQSAKRRVPAAPRLAARLIKRESGPGALAASPALSVQPGGLSAPGSVS